MAFGDKTHDSADGHPHASDAWLAAHYGRIERDSRKCFHHRRKDSPANGTSATIFGWMSGS
jgi:hypothetical protein